MPKPRRILRRRAAPRRKYPKRKKGTNIAKNVNVKGDIHYFKRLVFRENISTAFNFYAAGYDFQLAHVPQVSEFTNLFDQFMLTKIVCQFHLKYDSSAQTPTGSIFPLMWICTDHDDVVAPANVNEMRERQRTRRLVLYPNKVLTHSISPSTLTEIYHTALTTSYSPQYKKWLDLNQSSTPYFGLKIFIDNLPSNQSVDFECTYYFACKGVR